MNNNPQQQSPEINRMDILRQKIATGTLDDLKYKTSQGRRVVAIDKLVEDPNNERKTYIGLEELAASIREVGIIEPITASPLEGDRFMILSGHRRFRAGKMAGLAEVEIILREQDEDAEKRRIKSLVTNVQREDVNPVELAVALKSLTEDGSGRTQTDVAKLMGKSKAWVSDMLKILDLKPKLLAKVRSTEHRIDYTAASRIARVKNEQKQTELIGMLLRGATQKDIKSYISSLEGKLPVQASVSEAKPKQTFRTSQGTAVIIQSLSSELTPNQGLESLREAVQVAEKNISGVEAA